jgi:hypothetical protein
MKRKWRRREWRLRGDKEFEKTQQVNGKHQNENRRKVCGKFYEEGKQNKVKNIQWKT